MIFWFSNRVRRPPLVESSSFSQFLKFAFFRFSDLFWTSISWNFYCSGLHFFFSKCGDVDHRSVLCRAIHIRKCRVINKGTSKTWIQFSESYPNNASKIKSIDFLKFKVHLHTSSFLQYFTKLKKLSKIDKLESSNQTVYHTCNPQNVDACVACCLLFTLSAVKFSHWLFSLKKCMRQRRYVLTFGQSPANRIEYEETYLNFGLRDVTFSKFQMPVQVLLEAPISLLDVFHVPQSYLYMSH